jgi:hypothetical protein
MKRLYGGDIFIKKAGNEFKWLITPGEIFIVGHFVKSDDDFDYLLIYRPFQNHIKNFFYMLTHIQIKIK